MRETSTRVVDIQTEQRKILSTLEDQKRILQSLQEEQQVMNLIHEQQKILHLVQQIQIRLEREDASIKLSGEKISRDLYWYPRE